MFRGVSSGVMEWRLARYVTLLFFCVIPWSIWAAPANLPTKLDPVRVQLKWVHQFQFAGYYAALEKGFYREAGLDVSLVEAQPGLNTEDQVLSGAVDFGVGSSSILLLRAQGKPVVVLAVIFQHSPSILLALRDTGIDTIHDLIGKTIMIEPNAAANLGYLRAEGVLDKIRIVRQSFDLNDLISGKVAALSSFSTNEPYTLKKAGIPYREFFPRDGGVDFYGDNLYTTEQQIVEHPERVKAFRQATLRGWSYAMAHVDEMVDLIHAKYAPGRAPDALRFEAQELGKVMERDLIEVGYMNAGRWRHIAEVYARLGMLPENFHKEEFLEEFLYEPNPHKDYTWLLWGFAITAGAVAVALAVIVYITRMNNKLLVQMTETQRMKEMAERANEEKQRFIATASHDLRQPVYALNLFVDALSQYELPKMTTQIVGGMRQLVGSMSELLDGLMDVSMLDAHILQPKRENFPIAELIARLHEEFLPMAHNKGLRFEHVTSSAVVYSDPLLLERILRNFLTNAMKYCESGRILIGCRRRSASLCIEVHDTGPGIPTDRQKEIFREFTRLNNRSDAPVTGMGLGLAIVKRLATTLDHPLELRSLPGTGSVFSVEVRLGEKLPVHKCLEDIQLAPLNLFVVVIDDEASFRAGLQTILTVLGCETWGASSWEDCVTRLNEISKPPNIIISDYHLGPGENGLVAILRLRAIFNALIPAILVTCDMTRAYETEAEALGVSVLLKPLSARELHKMLISKIEKNKEPA